MMFELILVAYQKKKKELILVRFNFFFKLTYLDSNHFEKEKRKMSNMV